MKSCAKTAVYGGKYMLGGHGEVPLSFDSLQQIHRYVDGNPMSEYTVEQNTIDSDDLLKSFQVLSEIGSGSYGSAFLARSTILGDCVVKIYTGLLDLKALRIDHRGRITVNKRLLGNSEEEFRQDFNEEVHNLHKVLTPEKLKHDFYFENSRLMRVEQSKFEPLLREAMEYRTHSGHQFIHHFIHYDPTLFLIISEPCLGNVKELIQQKRLREGDMKDFVVQVGLAIHYMMFVVKVAHTDIKPENIFWKRDPGGFTFKVSDFGYLDELDGPEHSNDGFLFTPLYVPPVIMYLRKQHVRNINTAKIMLYEYFMSILDLLYGTKRGINYKISSHEIYSRVIRERSLLNLFRIIAGEIEELLAHFSAKLEDRDFWTTLDEDTTWKDQFHDCVQNMVSDTAYHIHI